MPDNPLDDQIAVRINSEDKVAFIERCERLKRPHQVMLRELITAFNEDRIKIAVTENHMNQLKGIYYVPGK